MYVTVSFHGAEGEEWVEPREVFVQVAKQGTTVSGVLDGVCVLLSVALQHGIPWADLRGKLLSHRFEDAGDPDHSSILDGLAKCVDFLIEERRKAVL